MYQKVPQKNAKSIQNYEKSTFPKVSDSVKKGPEVEQK